MSRTFDCYETQLFGLGTFFALCAEADDERRRNRMETYVLGPAPGCHELRTIVATLPEGLRGATGFGSVSDVLRLWSIGWAEAEIETGVQAWLQKSAPNGIWPAPLKLTPVEPSRLVQWVVRGQLRDSLKTIQDQTWHTPLRDYLDGLLGLPTVTVVPGP